MKKPAHAINEEGPMSTCQTLCKNCVFAQYRSKRQTGCNAGVFDRDVFKTEMVVSDEDGVKYIMLPHNLCIYHRRPPWGNVRHVRYDENKKSINCKKLLEKARGEIKLTIDVVVMFNKQSTYKKLRETIQSLNKQSRKPTRICVLNMRDESMHQKLCMFVKSNATIPWRVETVRETETKWSAVDLTLKKVKSSFYAYCESGYTFNEGFFQSIYRTVYINLQKIVAIYPVDKKNNGLVVLTFFHKQAGGNRETPIIEKAEKACRKKPHLMKKQPL